MKAKTNFRVRVMKYAWHLKRTTGQTWQLCLIKSWQLYRLACKMRHSVVVFFYQKADGTIRKAHGTLRNLPAGATLSGKRITKPSFKTFAYFDVHRNAFRSFRIENLICVE